MSTLNRECAEVAASSDTLERVHYFYGQLLSAQDLEQEQEYFRSKLRRHNRLLHGWGIVCGLQVAAGPGAAQVTVEPGYALDRCGNEIVVDKQVVVDLAHGPDEGQRFFVSLCYQECLTDPVPVSTGEGGTLEYSRVVDSYQVAALTSPPHPGGSAHGREELPTGPCPERVDNAWLILAVVSSKQGRWETDETRTREYRRYVVSHAQVKVS